MKAEIDQRAFRIALAALCIAAFAYGEWIAVTQFRSLNVYLADVGSFHSVIAGPWHGNWLRTPVAWDVEGANYFGIHFQPVLLVLTPLCGLWDSPLVFLSALVLALAGAAWLLGLWGARLLGHRAAALGLAAAFLANHFVGSIQLANHPEALAIPAFFGLFLAVERRRPPWAAAAALAVLAVKEDFALYVLLYGLSLLAEPDRGLRKWAAWIAGGAVAWGIAAVVIMRLCGSEARAAGGATAASRFAAMGDSAPEVIGWMATHPATVLGRFFSAPLFWLYASTLGLALLDWRAGWLAAVAVAPVLICDDELLRTLPYYYSYPAVPFLFYSTARGMRTLLEARPKARERLGWALAAALVVAALVQAPLPTRTDGWRRVPFRVEERHRLVPDIVRMIPADATVAVQYELFPQVPQRPTLVPFRLQHLAEVDWLFLDSRRVPADLRDKGDEFPRILEELRGEDWETEFEAEGFLLMRRKAAAR